MRLRRPSALFRSALALLLVLAQIFAAAHAVGHVADLLAPSRGGAVVEASSFDGGVPEAARHESCLLCLATAGLSAAPPPCQPVLAVALPALPLPDGVMLPGAARTLLRPPSRGPPSFS